MNFIQSQMELRKLQLGDNHQMFLEDQKNAEALRKEYNIIKELVNGVEPYVEDVEDSSKNDVETLLEVTETIVDRLFTLGGLERKIVSRKED